MSEEIIVALIAALGGGALTTIAAGVFNRRKTNADATKVITDATKEILGEYRTRNDELEAELREVKNELELYVQDLRRLRREVSEERKQVEQEQALQDKNIENQNAMIMKLQLANEILIRQIRSLGIEPLLSPTEISTISIRDLRDIADSLADIDYRRESRCQEKPEETDDGD